MRSPGPSFDGAVGSVPADTVGTVILAGLSLSLVWLGTHWRKSELVWLLHGIMALCGYTLATWDFMNEPNLAFAVSLRLLRGKPAERVT